MPRQNRTIGRALRAVGWTTLFPAALIGVSGERDLRHLWGDPDSLAARYWWLAPAKVSVASALLLFSWWAIRRGGRHLTPVLDSMSTLTADTPIVLLLRVFPDDERIADVPARAGRRSGWGALPRTEEEQLAAALSPFGTLVALADPTEDLPQVGALRTPAADHEWRAVVRAGITRARLVLIVCAPGRHLRWEAEQAVAHGDPTKLVLVVPDEARYQAFREVVGPVFPQPLPDHPGASSGIESRSVVRAAVWFEPDWTPRLGDLDFPGSLVGVLAASRTPVRTGFPLAILPVFRRAHLTPVGLPDGPRPRPTLALVAAATVAASWSPVVWWMVTTRLGGTPTATTILAATTASGAALLTARTAMGGYLSLKIARWLASTLALLMPFGIVARGIGLPAVLVWSGFIISFLLLRCRPMHHWTVSRLLYPPDKPAPT
ncbi:hypothetical protein [Actinokineospora enzanensis]|uniref:hypothetical protein n=1 Tax=Actinokineospora enzanensis TaxID=155975 RepID=UPI0012EC6C32|nr:hypothetical protein [Actinokineospora enzanensis]